MRDGPSPGTMTSVAREGNRRRAAVGACMLFLALAALSITPLPARAATGFEICTTASACLAGKQGGLGGEMRIPSGVAADAAGNVYVADQFNHRIQKFDSDGNFMRAWGRDVVQGGTDQFEICVVGVHTCKTGAPGGGAGQLSLPSGVATDGTFVYVADFGNDRIQKFGSDGQFLITWGKDVNQGGGTDYEICNVLTSCKKGAEGDLGGERHSPYGVATDGSKVYVAERDNDRVQRFDLIGGWERAWGKDVDSAGGTDFEICITAGTCQAGDATGGLAGEMDSPVAVAADGAMVYVADSDNNRVQSFDLDGDPENVWGKAVNADLPGDGFEVCKFASSGDTCQVGALGGLGGEMGSPRAIAADGSKVYVADTFNLRVQRFDSVGGWELAWGKDVNMTLGGTGFEVCTVASADVCKAGAAGTLGGEMGGLEGVAAAAGKTFVADRDNERIQRFDSGTGAWERAWGKDVFDDPPPPTAGSAAPSNDFTFGKLKRKKKKGIAFLFVNLPGPGEVGLAGKGVKGFGAGVARASRFYSGGRIKLKIRPGKKGKKARRLKRRLRSKGKAKLKVRVTFVPTGGTANTRKRKLKLVQRKPR